MQVTNLSKTVNLLIVGVFLIANIIFVYYLNYTEGFNNLLRSFENLVSKSLISIVFGIATISFSIFLGLIVESLTERLRSFVVWLLRKFNIYLKFSKLFLNIKAYSGHDYWKNKVTEVKEDKFPHLEISSDEKRAFWVAYMFAKASPSQVDWVIKHHATYLLASNFVLIILMNCVFSILTSSVVFTFISLALLYIMVQISIDKYLYAYESVYRFAVCDIAGNNNQFVDQVNKTELNNNDNIKSMDQANNDSSDGIQS